MHVNWHRDELEELRDLVRNRKSDLYSEIRHARVTSYRHALKMEKALLVRIDGRLNEALGDDASVVAIRQSFTAAF